MVFHWKYCLHIKNILQYLVYPFGDSICWRFWNKNSVSHLAWWISVFPSLLEHHTENCYAFIISFFAACLLVITGENIWKANSGRQPTSCTISHIICLFESSTCFEQLCAHPQEDNCINLLKTKHNLLYIRNHSVNTFHHGYKNQSINDIQSKSRCLFWDPYKTLSAKRAPCWIFEC